MPRIKVDYTFDVELFDSNKATKSGNFYSLETLADISHNVTMGTKYYVNEFSPLERELNHIRQDEVWKDKIMGECIGSNIVDGKLIMTIKCSSNRNGKRLKEICESVGIKKMEWFPVGYGVPVNENGKNVIKDYKLIYISF